ncbi:tetratricopeptide repeat protein [Persephonella sp.]
MEMKGTAISFIFEMIALYFLFFGDFYGKILLFFFFHLLATLLISAVVWTFIPNKYKRPFPLSLVAIAVIIFATPVLSYIAVVAFLVLFRRQKKLPVIPMETVPMFHLIEENIQIKKRKFGESSVREFVFKRELPSDLRLKAFLFLTEIKSPESVRLLKYGLADQNDEIRLLSFSVLDKIEKKLNEQIHENLEKLKETKDIHKKGEIYRDLAKLYWENIYIGMADKEITDFYLNEAEKYAIKSLDIIKDDPYIHLLLGRLYLIKDRLEDAYKYLVKALNSGIPEFKVVPYLAEIFYRKKKYSEIKNLIGKHPYLKYDPAFYSVVLLWEEN